MTGDFREHSFESLSRDLVAAGFSHADNIIMHSSLKSLGKIEGGASTVVRALSAVLGKTGNLMVPTFTYCMPSWGIDPFHINNTVSRVGYLTEFIRENPHAVRSFHPTHSVAVLGPDAYELTANHIDFTPLGRNSPYDRMRKRNAKLLLLGTDQRTNSSLHLMEVLANLPYVNISFTAGLEYEVAWFYNEDDQLEYTSIFEVPGCSRGFNAIDKHLRTRNIIREFRIGDSVAVVILMQELENAVIDILKTHPLILLCHLADCDICTARREFMLSKKLNN